MGEQELDVVDCGDNSCLFAEARGGMRTNGGCRCFDELPASSRRQLVIWVRRRRLATTRDLELLAKLRAHPGLRDALKYIETESACWYNVSDGEPGAEACADALCLAVQLLRGEDRSEP